MALSKAKISQLRCPIEVKGRVRTPDSIGGFDVAWVSRGTTWALIEAASKGALQRAGRPEQSVGQRVVIRKDSIPRVEAVEEVPAVPFAPGYLLVTFAVPLSDDADPTGLPNDATELANVFTVGGVPHSIAVVGQDAQTYAELIEQIEGQAPVVGSIVDGTLRLTPAEGVGTVAANVGGEETNLLTKLANWNSYVSVPGVGNDFIPGTPGSPGITVDDAIHYDGREMSISAIANINEGNVEFVELICVESGDVR